MGYFIKKLLVAIAIGAIWLICFAEFAIFLAGCLFGGGFSGILSEFLPVGIMTIILLIYLWTVRCKECGKFFSYRNVGTKQVKSEDISVKVELNDYNTSHEVRGTHEQYIAGTRNTYRTCYRCKNCRHEFYKKFSKDSARV
ncbi:MAG: hypothetical protein K6E91_00165 [Butyrivibrio sp.]|nr:hypothetical protein [Butyrivibrio sp.]